MLKLRNQMTGAELMELDRQRLRKIRFSEELKAKIARNSYMIACETVPNGFPKETLLLDVHFKACIE